MNKKFMCLLLALVMSVMLMAGCGGSNDSAKNEGATIASQSDNNQAATNEDQNETESQSSQQLATVVIADAFGEKQVEITYNPVNCEEQGNDGYFVNFVSTDDLAYFSVEFYAEYSADQYYNEQVSAFATMGLIASDLENYANGEFAMYGFDFYEEASGEKYSYQLLVEVDGGLLIVHNPDLDVENTEYAKIFAEKVLVSVNVMQADAASDNVTANTGNNLALTNEEKEKVYKAEYEAIKDQIVAENVDGDDVSYLDAGDNAIMFVEYDDESIVTVMFFTYYDNAEKKSSRVFSFNEDGTYGFMDFEYHENGNKKTETVYNEDGSKLVFSFDESGDYVSGTEYDKNGNIVE